MAPKFLGHSAVYFIARVVSGAVNILAIGIYTRLLQPDQYGHYVVVLAGMDFAHRTLFRWLEMGLVRYLPAYKDRRSVFLSTAAAGFSLAVSITVIVGIVTLIIQPKGLPVNLISAGIILLWVNTWFELNLELIRADLSPKRYGIMEIIRSILALGTGALLAYLGYGAFGVLTGLIVGRMIPALLFMMKEWRFVRFSNIDLSILKRLLNYGLPLMVSYAVAFLIDASDRILLSLFKGPEASGLYAAGYDIAQRSIVMLTAIIHLAAYPLAVRALEDGGIKAAQEQMRQNFQGLLLVAMPAAVGLILLAPNLSATVLGKEFQETARTLIPIIATGIFFFAIRSFYANYAFQLTGRTSYQMWIVIVTAILNVSLNLWLIPKLGITGAAYASVSSYFFAMILSIYMGRRIFPLPFHLGDISKIVIITGLMALALWPTLKYDGVMILALQILIGLVVVVGMSIIYDILGIRSVVLRRIKRRS